MAKADVQPRGPAEPEEPRRPEEHIERAIARLYRFLGRNRWTRFPWAVVQTFSQAQGALLSGSMAYYTFLSLLPLLMVAGFVLGTLANRNQAMQQAVLTAVAQIFPGVSGQEILDQLIGARVAFGLFGLASLAYAGSGFIGAMTACMNRMWGVESGRNPVGQKGLNLLIVMLLTCVLLGSVGVTLWVVATARAALGEQANPFVEGLEQLSSPISTLIVLLLLYRLLPARKHSLLSQLPGAVFGALGFEALKWVFRLWADNSAGIAALPRSLVSVVLLLVWLGFFGQLILYGAAINVVISRRRSIWPGTRVPQLGPPAAGLAGASGSIAEAGLCTFILGLELGRFRAAVVKFDTSDQEARQPNNGPPRQCVSTGASMWRRPCR
jgi:membrane protein